MIKGVKELTAKLNRLKNVDLEPIIESAASKVKDEAKLRVPKDTGQLKDSIFHEVKTSKSKVEGLVFTNMEYAPYVEFGTGPIGAENHAGISPEVNPRYSVTGWSYFDKKQKKWIHTRGQKAQPFMYPAINDNRQRINNSISEKIKKAIKESIK